jgi:hypothetical protein
MRGGLEWYPKDGLEVQNGTGDIFWKPVMPNAIFYANLVDDPLYSAHRKVQTYQGNATRYLPDYPLKGVGCLQQVCSLPRHAACTILITPKHEICHARRGKSDFCTPLQYRPYYELRPGVDFPEANSMQQAILRTFLRASRLFESPTMRSCQANQRQSRNSALIESIPNGF